MILCHLHGRRGHETRHNESSSSRNSRARPEGNPADAGKVVSTSMCLVTFGDVLSVYCRITQAQAAACEHVTIVYIRHGACNNVVVRIVLFPLGRPSVSLSWKCRRRRWWLIHMRAGASSGGAGAGGGGPTTCARDAGRTMYISLIILEKSSSSWRCPHLTCAKE